VQHGEGLAAPIMTSPHLLRPFSSRQLSLVADDGRVVCFAVLGGRYVGPSVQVHAPTLVKRISELPEAIETVVFFDEPVPDAATLATIDDMLAVFAQADAEVLASYAVTTEAVKRVDTRGVAVEGVDRASLVSIRCPEVIDRQALMLAWDDLDDQLWVNPTSLVAARGGRVRLYDRSGVSTRS